MKNPSATTDEPIRIVEEKQQQSLLESWCHHIENTQRNCSAQLGNFSRNTHQLSIFIKDVSFMSEGYYPMSEQLHLQFKDGALRMGFGYRMNREVPVTSLEQVCQTIESVAKKLQARGARRKKHEKIRDLKARSVEAQVDEIAQRLQFEYQVMRKHTKLVLAIALDEDRCLFVDIPLGKIQETIERLEVLIQQIKALYGEGLRFKIEGKPYGEFRKPKPAE